MVPAPAADVRLARPAVPKAAYGSLIAVGGLALAASAGWLFAVAWYVGEYIGWETLQVLLPHEQALSLAGAFLPVLVLWLVVLVVLRGAAVSKATRALMEQFDSLVYPPEAAADQVRRIGLSLAEQAKVLNDTSDTLLTRLDRLSKAFREQTQELTGASLRAASQSERVGEALKSQLGEIETARAQVAELLAESAKDSAAALAAERDALLAALATRNEETGAALKDQLDEIEMAGKRMAALLGSSLDESRSAMMIERKTLVDALADGRTLAAETLSGQVTEIEAAGKRMEELLAASHGTIKSALDEQRAQQSAALTGDLSALEAAGRRIAELQEANRRAGDSTMTEAEGRLRATLSSTRAET
ncbi:MAG: hypothetical protein ACREDZ_02280, partial [Kiloniellales bacterium]